MKDIPREAYYIGTKVGRYDWDGFDFSAEKTRSSFEESLKLLGLEYVDVIQVNNSGVLFLVLFLKRMKTVRLLLFTSDDLM